MALGSANPRLRLVRRVVGEPAGGTRPGALADLDDVQLVALSRDGDVRAFEALYRRHAAFAMNLAVRIQGSISDVEDVVHDAFLRAQLRLGELRETSAFKSWLGSIVVRLVLRKQRLYEPASLSGLHLMRDLQRANRITQILILASCFAAR